MTVYTFHRNKKITRYILICVILLILYAAIFPILLPKIMEERNPEFIHNHTKYIITVIVWVLCFFPICIGALSMTLYHSTAIYRLRGSRLTSGLLFKKTIDCKDIIRLRSKKDFLNIITKNKTITLNLSMLKCDYDSYKNLFKFIKDNMNDDIQFDKRIYDLINGQNIITSIDKPNLKIRGWLLLLYISMLQFAIVCLLSIIGLVIQLNSLKCDIYYYIDFFNVLAIFIILIVTIIFFTMKKSNTVKVLKLFNWACVVNVAIKNYIMLRNYSYSNYFLMFSIITLAINLFFVLAISEYLNTSIRVKNTFVN